MDNINKAILLPLVSGILIALKSLFHIQFDVDTANAIVDLILSVVAIVGIFMAPKKQVPVTPQPIYLPVQQVQPQEQIKPLL